MCAAPSDVVSVLRSLPRSAARFVVPALVALVAMTSVSGSAAASVATVHASVRRMKPPTKAHRKAASRKTTSRHTSKRVAKVTEPELPTLPPTVEVPSVDDLLSGRNTSGQVFATTALVTTPETAGSASGANPAGPLAAFSASASRMLESMVDRARSQLGTRYVFGGERPGQGLDCSSFARFAMEAMGIKLPRTAAQQARLGDAVPRDRKMLRPGDLLTFGAGKRVSHVGIYLGEGRFIHASVTSRKIIETTIDRNPRLFRRWQGARRLIADGDSTRRGDG
jgi:cell wall-associated NlpC family hydrolase